MKTVAKRILTLIVVFCMACVGLVCTPITGAKAADVSGSYVKVTSTPSDWSGDYLIVYEAGTVAFDGGVEKLDAVKNTIAVAISNNEIEANATTNAAKFTIDSNGCIQSASGFYIGATSNANALNTNKTTKYTNTLTVKSNGEVDIKSSGGAYLRYNAASDQCRFRYYKSASYTGQKAICLYKFVEAVQENPDAPAVDTAALDNVGAYMSLAYQYQVSTQTVATAGGTDKLNLDFIGLETYASYTSWSEREGASGAVYAGNSYNNYKSIQFNDSPSGIVTTQTAGKATKISVEWNGNTAAGRILNVYGKHTAYSSSSDLYDPDTAGVLIGTIKYDTSMELTIAGDYEYIGLRSASKAMYLTSISIEWNGGEAGTQEVTTFSDVQFKIRCAVDASLLAIDGVDEAGIYVAAGNKAVYYNEGNASSWTVDGDKAYVVINLGDVLTDNRAKTEFTVKAYVKLGDNVYTSDLYKAYSVAGMVNTYYKSAEISEELKGQLKHLYEYLNA